MNLGNRLRSQNQKGRGSLPTGRKASLPITNPIRTPLILLVIVSIGHGQGTENVFNEYT